jgi:hypothetical protein
MNKPVIHRSERLYGFLLNFYPKRYRQEFGEEMQYVFSESLKDAYAEYGERGIINLWARTIVDAGKTLVTQHLENQKGGDSMKTNNSDIIMQNKVFIWIALATGLILLIPLIAMLFTGEMGWGLFDFVLAGVLLFGTGSTFVLAARQTRKYRAVIGVVLAAALLYVWAELAVGVFTTLGS